MLYPIYVHKEQSSAFGAIVPDLPGVHSAADQLEHLPKQVQEAIELMYAGEVAMPPPPSAIESQWLPSTSFGRQRHNRRWDVSVQRAETSQSRPGFTTLQ